MKIISEIGLREFNTWSGATDTKNTIVENNKGDDFDSLIEELYPDGLSDTQLNDILWFDADYIYEQLDINQEEEEPEGDEEE
jgi:hypothetical protein